MELFLFRHAEYEQLYNCSGLNISQIPLEHRQFLPEAIVTILLSSIYYVPYHLTLIKIIVVFISFSSSDPLFAMYVFHLGSYAR